MYLSLGIVLFALLLCIVLGTCRKRAAIRKVCSMSPKEKCKLLSTLLTPFGYCYDSRFDIISSRNDAWQREAGYTALFDRAAASLNMIFDYLPVYFDYQGRTWLIELWKGQYGINTGAEIGIYYADRILSPDEFSTAHFKAVEDEDMLPLSFSLFRRETLLATISKRTWWLTAFCMGQFSHPCELCMKSAIQFQDRDMLSSFLNALYETGIDKRYVRVCGCELLFCFCGAQNRHYSFFARIIRCHAQFWNRIFCKIYLQITGIFCLTIDRLLYLYYLLPFVFRRILTPRKYCKCKTRHS